MSYTVLRVTEDGVVLFEHHLRRLTAAGEEAGARYRAFALQAAPGIYALHWQEGRFSIEPRSASRYADGMPVRFEISPMLHQNPSAKTQPPNPYTPLRLPGVITLLTSADGTEIYESCSASVISWRDGRVVIPPQNRPRIISTSEAALRERLKIEEAPILRDATWPLAVVNAVAGLCRPEVPGRSPFPAEGAELIQHVFRASTARQ